MAVFGLIVYVSLFLVHIEAKTYTVVPGMSVNTCASQTNCSLMYYATHSSTFFTKGNTEFLFLTGDHLLVNSTCVYMANTSNIALRSDDISETRVLCNGQNSGSFSFYNITNLTIENLSFIRCSGSAEHFRGLTAVEIHLIHNMNMSNIYINGTTGYGLSLTNLYGSSVLSNITVDSSYSTSNAGGGNFAFYCSDDYTSQEDAMLTHSLNVNDSYFIKGVNSFYEDHSTSSGMYFHMYCRTKLNIVLDKIHLIGNKADSGGNMGIKYVGTSSQWTVSFFIVNSEISHGIANAGGGIYIVAIIGSTNYSSSNTNLQTNKFLTIENTLLEFNTARYAGGGFYGRLHQNPSTAVGMITFRENCTFQNNKLVFFSNDTSPHGGTGVHIVIYTLPEYKQHNIMLFVLEFSECTFFNNSIHSEISNSNVFRTGALYVENAQAMYIEGCEFTKNKCTGIATINSNILFRGVNTIHGNTAYKGGGMFFCSGSMMHLYNGTRLTISENSAELSGGGIYVDNECSPAVSYCFFQVDNITADNTTLHQTQVHLINNTASGGNALYGGLIDSCILFDKPDQKYAHGTSGRIFNATFHIQTQEGDLTVISSDPTYIGFCEVNSASTTEDLIRNCPQTITVEVMPGSIFHISAIIMGQRHGLVAGTVDVKCIETCAIPDNYYSQFISKRQNKTKLTYSVIPRKGTNVTLELVTEDYYFGYPTYRYQPSYIYVTIKKCPLGFREENRQCSCGFLKDITCNITKQTLNRSNTGWIGYKEQPPHDTTEIINHPYCPLGYCLNKAVAIKTTPEHFDQDVQCAIHRTGLLCGRCKANYSLGFGSSQCLSHCSSELQFLRVIGLIAVCAVAGILLVVLLTLLNLTVAEGTLNGLIFYANVIQVNNDLFFPPETHARLWTAFIAWLNLDFGVTVCFYDGMDAYAKTWLQFIFPLYIWLISGGIVYFSRKYKRVAQSMGKNAVKVLATLFLLSFGKLIRTVIAVVSFSQVQSNNMHLKMVVWLQDATVHYLHGHHIVLWIAGAITGLLAFLYALTLTFIQCLRRTPNNGMFVWVRRLKPLLDAYTGPYKDRYHFWTGFLLLVRIFLFIAFALNFKRVPVVNFTLIIIVSTILMIAIQPGIYRNQLLGILESSLYVNLILFSALMAACSSNTEYETIAVFLFSGWALLTFSGIVVYHLYKQWYGTQNCLLVCKENLSTCVRKDEVVQPMIIEQGDSEQSEESESEKDECELSVPEWSTPQVREPLLGSD